MPTANNSGGGLTGMDYGLLGLQGLSGLLQGFGNRSQGQQNRRDQAQQRVDEIMRMLMQFEQGKLDRGSQSNLDFAQLFGPLGQEQQYVQNNNIRRAILPQMGNTRFEGPRDPAVRALMPQTQNPLAGLMENGQLRPDIAQTFSDQATSRALTDRRKMLAGVNPDYVFQPLGDYGLGGKEGDIFNQEVHNAGKLVADQRDAGYRNIQALLDQQKQGAEQQLADTSKSGGGGTSWWRKILGPAAGIAASFIPGVGPLVSGLIGTAIGGASSGVQGAILGGGAGLGGDQLSQLFRRGGGAGTQLNNAMGPESFPLGSGVQSGQMQLQNQFNPMDFLQQFQGAVGQNRPSQQAPIQPRNTVGVGGARIPPPIQRQGPPEYRPNGGPLQRPQLSPEIQQQINQLMNNSMPRLQGSNDMPRGVNQSLGGARRLTAGQGPGMLESMNLGQQPLAQIFNSPIGQTMMAITGLGGGAIAANPAARQAFMRAFQQALNPQTKAIGQAFSRGYNRTRRAP